MADNGTSTPTAAAEDTSRPMDNSQPAEISQAIGESGSPSRKRSASTTLESNPVKVAKSSEAGDVSREGSVATVKTTETGGEGKEDEEQTVESLGNAVKKRDAELKFLKDKANSKLKDLRAEVISLKEAAKQSETEIEQLKQEKQDLVKDLSQERDDFEVLKKSRSSGEGMSKGAESKYIANFTKKYEDKISELKASAKKAEKDAKQAKAAVASKEKDIKKAVAEIEKDLRAEKAADVKRFKAENSSEVKEKRDLVKMLEKNIQTSQAQNKVAGEQIDELEAEKKRLETLAKKDKARIKDYEENIRRKEEFTNSIGQQYAKRSQQAEQKAEHESKRCAKYRALYDEAMRKLTAQQRDNFVLRNANELKVEKIKKVMADMRWLRGMAPVGEGAEDAGKGGEGDEDAEGSRKKMGESEGAGKGGEIDGKRLQPETKLRVRPETAGSAGVDEDSDSTTNKPIELESSIPTSSDRRSAVPTTEAAPKASASTEIEQATETTKASTTPAEEAGRTTDDRIAALDQETTKASTTPAEEADKPTNAEIAALNQETKAFAARKDSLDPLTAKVPASIFGYKAGAEDAIPDEELEAGMMSMEDLDAEMDKAELQGGGLAQVE